MFFFIEKVTFRIRLGLPCFLINCYGGGQTETSELLEKIQNLFTVYADTFDQSHMFNFDL